MTTDQRAKGIWARSTILAATLLCAVTAAAQAADAIKIGFSDEETGGAAANGRQFLLAAQIWAAEVNATGGLLGRPVELVHYDDQSNPATIPGIYAKLLDIDKVDLAVASGTNFSAAALPMLMQHNFTVFNTLALAVNDSFKYPRYFQTMPFGPNGKDAISRGYFAAAMAMTPKPRSIALAGADAEFAKNALDGARRHANEIGLSIVYDRTYPPNTIDYSPVVRAIKASTADLVFIASYPADTAGMLRAIGEVGLDAKMVGGPMNGLQYGALKMQLGERLNGLVAYELYVHEPSMVVPGIDAFIAKYQARAAEAGTDPLGYYVPPIVYATFQILQQAVEATRSLDQDKLADYAHRATFKTISGDIQFGPDGEQVASRLLTIQYQHVKGHDLAQFTRPGVQVILDPPALKTGTLQFPYSEIAKP